MQEHKLCRAVAGILLLATLLLSCAGCGPTDTAVPPSWGEDDYQYLDGLGDRNYGGDEFTVSVLDTYKVEAYAEEDSTEVLDEAVYKRNRRLEDRFNIKIVPHVTLPNMPNQAAHITYMQNCFNDESAAFDVGLLMAYKAGIMVMDGMLYAQREWLPYVRDSLKNGAAWWSNDINSAFTVLGKQYVSVSDWCITTVSMTYSIAFNKQYEEDNNIAEGLGYSSMYDIVLQNAWTMENLRTLVKDLGEDLGEDERVDIDNDFLGFACDTSTALDAFAASAGLQYVKNNGEGTPEIFSMTPREIKLFEELAALFHGPGDGVLTEHYSDKVVSAFTQGRVFMAALPLMRYAEESFHMMDDEYGILPYPKLDANQASYHAGTVDNFSTICILAVHDLSRMEFIGTVTEAISAETHNSVIRPYYELIVTHKNTHDEQSIAMIELMMKGRLYDLATLHTSRIYYVKEDFAPGNHSLYLLVRRAVNSPITDISSHWEAVSGQLDTCLGELVEEYVNMY